MMIYEGQTNDQDELLLLDKWANEPGWRVRAWRLPNGDVRIEFVNAGSSDKPDESLTLASYRADDLMQALARSIIPRTP